MDLCNSVEHGCEHQCVSAPGSYYCICPEGRSLQEDAKSCGSKCPVVQSGTMDELWWAGLPVGVHTLFSSACRSANIDLVLLIDGSKSVRPQNFELVKKFVNQVGKCLTPLVPFRSLAEGI